MSPKPVKYGTALMTIDLTGEYHKSQNGKRAIPQVQIHVSITRLFINSDPDPGSRVNITTEIELRDPIEQEHKHNKVNIRIIYSRCDDFSLNLNHLK